MEHHSRHPSLSLISSPSPAEPVSSSPTLHRPSPSPFRYLQFPEHLKEDGTQLSPITPGRPPSSSRLQFQHVRPQNTARVSSSTALRQKSDSPPSPRVPTRRLQILLKPWIPIIIYVLTSLAFVIGIAFYKSEVFTALDDLSRWLQDDEYFGFVFLFLLIFVTTIPPIPLYSTLIVLSGYTFGAWNGAIVSYLAALMGAVAVFLTSRTFFQKNISAWLSSTKSMSRVVRAIEKRPKLLFLIRLAPYPYNVMNCLLAAAPSLSFSTYFFCTALSLFKILIHTSIGASIHSFKEYHTPSSDPNHLESEDAEADSKARIWTIIGGVLCVAILIYIAIIARRAVDGELEGASEEEDLSLLSDVEAGPVSIRTANPPVMSESPFSNQFSLMNSAYSSRCD